MSRAGGATGGFVIECWTPLPVPEAWRRVTDWERHAAGIPLTHVAESTPPPTRAGSRFTARTGWRRLAFDDPMEVVLWEPPTAARQEGRCRLDKRGGFLRGWAQIEVMGTSPGPGPGDGAGSRVVWREELKPRAVPGFLDPLLARGARVVFRRAVERLLRAE